MTFLRITLLCWRPSPSLKESVLKAHCSVPVLTFLFAVLGYFSKPRANLQLQGPWPNVCFTLERTPEPCGGFRRKSRAPRLHLLLLRSVSSDPLSHLPTPRESLYAVSSLVFCLEINQVNRKILANLDVRTVSVERPVLRPGQKWFVGVWPVWADIIMAGLWVGGGWDLTVGTSSCGNCSGYFTLSKPSEFDVFHIVYLSALSP